MSKLRMRENDQHTNRISEKPRLKLLLNKFVLVFLASSLHFCPISQIPFCIDTSPYSIPQSLTVALFTVYDSKTAFLTLPWNFLPFTFQHEKRIGTERSWGLVGHVVFTVLEPDSRTQRQNVQQEKIPCFTVDFDQMLTIQNTFKNCYHGYCASRLMLYVPHSASFHQATELCQASLIYPFARLMTTS